MAEDIFDRYLAEQYSDRIEAILHEWHEKDPHSPAAIMGYTLNSVMALEQLQDPAIIESVEVSLMTTLQMLTQIHTSPEIRAVMVALEKQERLRRNAPNN